MLIEYSQTLTWGQFPVNVPQSGTFFIVLCQKREHNMTDQVKSSRLFNDKHQLNFRMGPFQTLLLKRKKFKTKSWQQSKMISTDSKRMCIQNSSLESVSNGNSFRKRCTCWLVYTWGFVVKQFSFLLFSRLWFEFCWIEIKSILVLDRKLYLMF